MKKRLFVIITFILSLIVLYFPQAIQAAYLGVPHFNQNDSRWDIKQLGTCYPETIGSHGCATTSKAMVFNYYHSSYTNPENLNTYLTNHGGYINGCEALWNTTGSPAEVQTCVYYDSNIENELNNAINSGYPVIARVTAPGIEKHFIVINGNDNNTIRFIDPWDGNFYIWPNGSLGKYSWNRIIVYRGNIPNQNQTIRQQIGNPDIYLFFNNRKWKIGSMQDVYDLGYNPDQHLDKLLIYPSPYLDQITPGPTIVSEGLLGLVAPHWYLFKDGYWRYVGDPNYLNCQYVQNKNDILPITQNLLNSYKGPYQNDPWPAIGPCTASIAIFELLLLD